MNADANKYVSMQRHYYDEGQESEEAIVGNYDYHENFPYETHLLHRYGDIRKPVVDDMANKIAFDIGCGEGRMIRRMSKMFARVDGADISSKMVAAARARCPSDSKIYLSDGMSCGEAQSSYYDLVYNTISLHHICVYDVRASIINDITRILKSTGCATLQFFFSRYYPYCRTIPPMQRDMHLVDLHHRDRLQATWFENRTEAQGTNSACDAAFGTDDIVAVVDDFKRWFNTVDVWFFDISLGRPDPRDGGTPRVLDEHHPNSHCPDDSWFTHMSFFHLREPKKSPS